MNGKPIPTAGELIKSQKWIDDEIKSLQKRKEEEIRDYIDQRADHWEGQILEIEWPNKSVPKEIIKITRVEINFDTLMKDFDLCYWFVKCTRDGKVSKRAKESYMHDSTVVKANIDIIFENLKED